MHWRTRSALVTSGDRGSWDVSATSQISLLGDHERRSRLMEFAAQVPTAVGTTLHFRHTARYALVSVARGPANAPVVLPCLTGARLAALQIGSQ